MGQVGGGRTWDGGVGLIEDSCHSGKASPKTSEHHTRRLDELPPRSAKKPASGFPLVYFGECLPSHLILRAAGGSGSGGGGEGVEL